MSSGVMEIIEGSKIGGEFKKIFASSFFYDELGHAVWPKTAINYTNKTQYLVRISKGTLDTADDYLINKKMTIDERRIKRDKMIYIGDGITDIPCMKLTKDGGGTSIAVYTEKNEKTARELFDDERINYYAPADYRTGSRIELIVKKTIQNMALDYELKDLNTNDMITKH